MGSVLFDILEFVAMLLFLRALVRNLGSLFSGSRIHVQTTRSASPPRPPASPHRGEMARDPICGMFVSTELSHRLTRGSQTLHFCSPGCLEKYQKEAVNVPS
jgi:YHS domain-containing protein